MASTPLSRFCPIRIISVHLLDAAGFHAAVAADQLRDALDRVVEERLQTIDRDLEREPERIRRTFALQTHRVEPAGAIDLWPQG